jgi:hypothetical protein
MDLHMGLVMLSFALALALYASLILLLSRVFQPKPNPGWFMVTSLAIVGIFLILPSLFIIVLGPATIQMMENMRVSAP